MTITACLVTWKRQNNFPKIIESLIKYPFISEILIRDNSKCENVINYGRYLLADQASNDIIFTQDDDCIIEGISQIYEKFIQDPKNVSHGGIWDYERVIKDNIYGKAQMAMFGWGSIFDRRWIPILKKYTDKYGKDYCFYRETDRIFSILLNRHHNFTQVKVTHLDGKDDLDALCQQPDHIRYKKLAIKRALDLIK